MVNMGELFANPRLINVDMDRVPLNDAESKSSMLASDDLLFARQSLVLSGAGKCSIFVYDDEQVCFESHVIRCRLNKELADPHFYFYFFGSAAGRKLIETIVEQGAGASGIRGSDLAELSVPWIDPSVQRCIAQHLRQLDDKIAVNRRINQTLEAMAQAIFKSWFVDFDPVIAKITAKAEGCDPLRAAMTAISGKPDTELDTLTAEQFTCLAATAALFPDEMEDSELGEIPKGWRVNKVGQLLELAYGKALKATDRIDGPIPVYGSGGVTGSHNAALVNHGSVIVGRKGTVGALYWEDGPFFPIDTTFYVRPIAAPMTYCFYLLMRLGLDKMNTDAAVPGLNRENVYRLEHVLPSSKTLEAFDSTASLLRSTIRASIDTSMSLSLLRDTLLPKLLTGELRAQAHDTEAAA
ncbi:restriction endonuclease subunit S [Xanthomonas campestris pv. campestris]|nr:restriction endonuclease subunit S [Xanthomonas campestris pv. campestris]